MDSADTRSNNTSRATVIIHILAACIALVGLTEASYLTVLALTGETAVCGGSAGCFQVLGSSYAKIGRMPVAGFGAAAYFSVFSFATLAAFGYPRARKFLGVTISLMFLLMYELV